VAATQTGSSLKGYIPALARLLGLAPTTLYERQRLLVRAGILTGVGGRGPGSGVKATVPSIAVLLVSVLGTDSLSEADKRVQALVIAAPKVRGRCPLTGARTFGDALKRIFQNVHWASWVKEIEVSKTADRANILFRNKAGNFQRSEFVGRRKDEPPIGWSSRIAGSVIKAIAADVRAMEQEHNVERINALISGTHSGEDDEEL
jgi:hypothetical protein